MLQHEHPVGYGQSQRSAAASLSGDDRDNGNLQGAHQSQALGNGFSLALFLRLFTGIGSRSIYKRNNGPAEFLRLTHQALGFAVALRTGHPKMTAEIILQIFPLPVAHYGDRPPVKAGNSAQNAGVLTAEAVSPLLKKVSKQSINIVRNSRTSWITGKFYLSSGV